MNSGSAFYIGKTHKICEDYASCGLDPEPYVLLSDGCSNSPKTDFGSRILIKIAENLLRKFRKDGLIEADEILIEADEIRRLINLPQESLDATLLLACVKDGKYHLSMCGDGVSVKTKLDGSMEVVMIEYPSGAPFYLNYSLNQTRKSGYVATFGLKRKVSTWTLKPDGTVENLVEKEDQDGNYYREEGFHDHFKSISLMSDGVLSFYELVNTGTSKIKNPIPVNQILQKLLDFKGFQGEFVDRRFQKFRKDCEKLNWFHDDDISLATLYLGENS